MKIAFIGTGNMGGALAAAASKDPSNELLLVNRHPEKAERLREKIGGRVVDHATAVAESDCLFLGVKPIALPGLMETLRSMLENRTDDPVIVSMAAGVTVAELQEMLPKALPVIRIMPNTPASVGEGMILYCCSAEVTEEHRSAFLSSMRHAGQFLAIEERLMAAGMAVSGCGPAFVDLFIEALSDAAVACGISRSDAIRLSAQMVLGSARLVLESGRHPGELKDAVCSPGGTTIQGVRKLEECGFRSSVIEAVYAAYGA